MGIWIGWVGAGPSTESLAASRVLAVDSVVLRGRRASWRSASSAKIRPARGLGLGVTAPLLPPPLRSLSPLFLLALLRPVPCGLFISSSFVAVDTPNRDLTSFRDSVGTLRVPTSFNNRLSSASSPPSVLRSLKPLDS